MENQTSFVNVENVVPLPKNQGQQTNDIILLLDFWKDVLNTKLLAVLALLGAVCMWGETIYEPDTLRIWASAIYSVVVLIPVLLLYARKVQ